MRKKVISILLLIPFCILFISGYSHTKKSDVTTHAFKFPKYPQAFGELIEPEDNLTTQEGVWLGRLLFYDSLLSVNYKQSCASCHQQNLAFSDGLKLAVGSRGEINKFNTMSLVNLGFEHNFFWDGRARTLEEQVPQPITNVHEMGLSEGELIKRLKAHAYYPHLFKEAFPDDSICMGTVSKAISQFLRTIISGGLSFPKYMDPPRMASGEPDTAFMNAHRKELSIPGAIYRMSFACLGCHNTGTYGGIMATNEVAQDSIFKVPSLINITLTAPYMHDGRFENLKKVLIHYKSHLSGLEAKNPGVVFPAPIIDTIADFDIEHADEIFSYFKDTTVLTNKAYSNPFRQSNFSWYNVDVKETK